VDRPRLYVVSEFCSNGDAFNHILRKVEPAAAGESIGTSAGLAQKQTPDGVARALLK